MLYKITNNVLSKFEWIQRWAWKNQIQPKSTLYTYMRMNNQLSQNYLGLCVQFDDYNQRYIYIKLYNVIWRLNETTPTRVGLDQ